MHFLALSFLLLPSIVFAEPLKWYLQNVTPNWYNVVRPYLDMLVNIASDNGNNVTILLPSDSAVKDFVDSPAYQIMTPQDIRQLVLYHTIRGNYRAKDLVAAGPFLRTLLQQPGVSGGQRLQVSGVSSAEMGEDDVYLYSGLGQNSSIWFGGTDFRTSDKLTLQVIDSVLTIPMSVTDTAFSAGLTSFAGAVTTLNVNSESDDDVTWFLPTNEAFQTVGSIFTDASDDELQNILNYHYLTDTGLPLYTSRIDKAQWNTAEGGNLRLSYDDDNSLFVNSAAVTQANILVANGVAHIIDQVLNPSASSKQPPAGSLGIPAFPNATRVSSPPFEDAVAGAGDSSMTELGAAPAMTPLGSLAPGYQRQMQQIKEESGAASNKGGRSLHVWMVLGPLVCWAVIFL